MKISDNFKYDFFLCYSFDDRQFSLSVFNELKTAGFNVFSADIILKTDIGKSYFSIINEALVNSNHFILICSPNIKKSTYVQTEYEGFFNEIFTKSNGKRRLIILKGPNFSVDIVPILLRGLQFANSITEIIQSLPKICRHSKQRVIKTQLNRTVSRSKLNLKRKNKSSKLKIYMPKLNKGNAQPNHRIIETRMTQIFHHLFSFLF